MHQTHSPPVNTFTVHKSSQQEKLQYQWTNNEIYEMWHAVLCYFQIIYRRHFANFSIFQHYQFDLPLKSFNIYLGSTLTSILNPYRDVSRTQSIIFDGALLRKQLEALAVNYFHKNAPLQRFDWVLNTLLLQSTYLLHYFSDNKSYYTAR